jgi:hypothetical protein
MISSQPGDAGIEDLWVLLFEAQALQPLRARFQPVGFMGSQAGGEVSLCHFINFD